MSGFVQATSSVSSVIIRRVVVVLFILRSQQPAAGGAIDVTVDLSIHLRGSTQNQRARRQCRSAPGVRTLSSR